MFGVTAALELMRRGFSVAIVDPGPLPHPDAASTDTSKAVRLDYGTDLFYTDLAERALEGWRSWDSHWQDELFHEVGVLFLTAGPMSENSFEGSSFRTLASRGWALDRLDRRELARRFPAWSSACYTDGYFNPVGGWVESGRVMDRLLDEVRGAGVNVRQGAAVQRCHEQGSRVTGILLEDGEILRADDVLVTGGAWTPSLLPQLAGLMWPTAQSVVHFGVPDELSYTGERFPVWCADIATTGWYGFPRTRQGSLKVGNHGPGRRVAASEPRAVPPAEQRRFQEFLGRTFPDLSKAPVTASRICLYCDTWDGNFWIDRDPERPGLTVAAGGSGHAFKFAPVLGGIVADVLEGRPNPHATRFAWRPAGTPATEQARH